MSGSQPRSRRLPQSLCALALAACTGRTPPAPPPDAGAQALPDTLVVPPPDAGPAELAEAQRLALELVHQQDVPQIRLDLKADLKAGDLLGVRPPARPDALLAKLGPPGEKRPEGPGLERWLWPKLGVEATVQSRAGVVRLALQAQPASAAGLGVFTGAVYAGAEPLNQLAPHLTLREVIEAIGPAGGRIQPDGDPIEVGWRHGGATLFLAFERSTQRLETVFTEPDDDALWAKLRPLAGSEALWKVDAPVPTGEVEYAPLGDDVTDEYLGRMPVAASGKTGAGAVFDQLEARLAQGGRKLRRSGGGRVVRLRIEGIELAAKESGQAWEARRFGGRPLPDVELRMVARLRDLFAAPASPKR